MVESLANQIMEFMPIQNNWLPLENLIEQAFSSKNPSDYYVAIFNLFERFPEEDGSGVFWSAVHGMEKVGNYEKSLLRFYRRYPTLMSKIMLVRLQNSGHTMIEGMAINMLI
jgi:hypothetical protein